MKSINLLVLISMSTVAFTKTAIADLTVVKHISFGEVAIVDNSVASTLTIFTTGVQVTSPNFAVIKPASPGEYLLSDLPPSTSLAISITTSTTTSSFSGVTPTQFTVEPFLDPIAYNTNALGELTIYTGANLKTSGNGKIYSDGFYYLNYTINIDY